MIPLQAKNGVFSIDKMSKLHCYLNMRIIKLDKLVLFIALVQIYKANLQIK